MPKQLKKVQEVIANELKPGDVLVNYGSLKSVKLTTGSVAVVVAGSLEETILGYREWVYVEPREDTMDDLAATSAINNEQFDHGKNHDDEEDGINEVDEPK